MYPLDSRIFAAILLMGIAALAVKVMEWWESRHPVVIDTQTNGGVKSGTAAAWR